MSDFDLGGNFVKFPRLRILKDCFPVFLVVSLYGLHPVLPRPFEPCLLLHAVVMSPIVDLHWFEVRLRTVFLQTSQSNWLFEVEEELDMSSSFLTSLKLPYCVDSFRLSVPELNELFTIHFGIVQSTQPVSLRHFQISNLNNY